MTLIQRVDTTAWGKPTHYYKIDGAKADGVTTLIGDGMRKKAIEFWSANFTAEYAIDNWPKLHKLAPSERLKTLKKCRFESRDAAANRGTEVHKHAEKLVHGDEVEVPDELMGYVESAAKFLDEWRIKPVMVEETVAFPKWNYAGTFDLVAPDPQGRSAIWDYKTSQSGIYGETALQLAAYANAPLYRGADDEGLEMPAIEVGYAVWIRPDGYDVYEMDISEQSFKTFLHVAYVARHTKDKNLSSLKSDALEVPSWN
jgi:hypothetical protein